MANESVKVAMKGDSAIVTITIPTADLVESARKEIARHTVAVAGKDFSARLLRRVADAAAKADRDLYLSDAEHAVRKTARPSFPDVDSFVAKLEPL